MILLGPFTAPESRLFAEGRTRAPRRSLARRIPRTFRRNPRVQRYAIDFAAEVPERALDYLKPSGKNLATIFAARMTEARVKTGTPADLVDLCAALVLLPRPVPIDHLAGVVAINVAHARDLAVELAPGLVLNDDRVGFADEDFEHFVREAGEAAMSRVLEGAANRLFMLRATDAYAATHVASLALLADRKDAVIALVREPVRDYPLADPAMRGEIHRRRLRAAMHVCRSTGNTIDAVALLLEGAHAIKTDVAVHGTLLDHIELAAHFSRDPIIALVLRNRERRPLHGTRLLQLAGVDGIEGDRSDSTLMSEPSWHGRRHAKRRSSTRKHDRRRREPLKLLTTMSEGTTGTRDRSRAHHGGNAAEASTNWNAGPLRPTMRPPCWSGVSTPTAPRRSRRCSGARGRRGSVISCLRGWYAAWYAAAI